jgi:hypothetical protein
VDHGDGVWIPEQTGSGINYMGLQPQASRWGSLSSMPTKTASSGTSIDWDEFQQQPRPPRQNPSTRASGIAGGTRGGTNPGFVNVGASWRDRTAEERAEATRQREREKQREAQQNLHVDDDDSDNISFDGDL